MAVKADRPEVMMVNLLERILGRSAKGSSATAKQRLQLVLVTDRSNLSPEKLQQMKDEIIGVISKYVNISPDKVAINVEQRERDNWLVADIPLLRELMQQEQGDVDDA
ncbi:MAG: cell division topological specificity factor MinE [Chloroflexota bacterium]